MPTILTSAMISSAINAVEDYIGTANSLSSDLDSVINTLTSSNFQGDASDGYKAFYTEKVMPAINENLTGSASLTKSIKDILESIQTQLLNTVDPQLGDSNRNPGVSG